ncbi:MAG: hypothetical protein ACJAQW_001867, partial [Paracoccaceae bacterium]
DCDRPVLEFDQQRIFGIFDISHEASFRDFGATLNRASAEGKPPSGDRPVRMCQKGRETGDEKWLGKLSTTWI